MVKFSELYRFLEANGWECTCCFWQTARGSFRTTLKYMNMERIYAIIERGEDGGFSIYAKDIPGLVGTGMTEEEARQDFMDVKEEQAEYYLDKTGREVEWKDMEIEFNYSLSAFFMAFPYINATQFARAIGINPSLMRKYKMGLVSASDKQKQIIQAHLNELTTKMQHVQFA